MLITEKEGGTLKKQMKIVAIGISLLLIFCSLSSCGNKQETVMSEERGNVITLGEYSLMASLLKGNMAYYIRSNYGDYNSKFFWETITDGETQMTYKDYYTVVVEEKAKMYLAALTIYDELGLKLPDETLSGIDAEIEEYIKEDGNGSKRSLNAILEKYGSDIESLRNYKIMNAKISQLRDEIYGKSGSKIAANVKQQYLEENYVAFKQILIPTYRYVYMEDDFGDKVYYRKNEDGTGVEQYTLSDGTVNPVVAYDKINGVKKPISDDASERDENGDYVYYVDTNYKKIAYDTENGVTLMIYGEDGYAQTEAIPDDEIKQAKARAEELHDIVNAAETVEEIDALILENDGNYNSSSTGKMFYLANNVSYKSFMVDGDMFDEIKIELAELDTWEATVYHSEHGYHVLIRYEVEDGAYANSEYSGWFEDDDGNYDFNANLVNDLFMARLEPYEERITVDKEVAKKVDISTIEPNYYFY